MLGAPNNYVKSIGHSVWDNVRMSELRDRLQECIDDKGTTWAYLVHLTGVSRATASEWRSGDTEKLSAENLLKLSDFFGVLPWWLYNGKGPKRREVPNLSRDAVSMAEQYDGLPDQIRQAIKVLLAAFSPSVSHRRQTLGATLDNESEVRRKTET